MLHTSFTSHACIDAKSEHSQLGIMKISGSPAMSRMSRLFMDISSEHFCQSFKEMTSLLIRPKLGFDILLSRLRDMLPPPDIP